MDQSDSIQRAAAPAVALDSAAAQTAWAIASARPEQVIPRWGYVRIGYVVGRQDGRYVLSLPLYGDDPVGSATRLMASVQDRLQGRPDPEWLVVSAQEGL